MGRAPCCDKMGLKKGPWTAEEDKVLVDFIRRNGHGNWRALPRQAGLLRCGKSCRLRWTNYLRPDIKRGNFSVEEEDAVIKLHQLLGNRWSAIASRLPGRTDNEIKNVWNTHLKKRLLRMGIDPVTHGATMASSSEAQRNGYKFVSVEYTAPSMRDSDASVNSTSTSLYTGGEFGGQPLSEVETDISAINSPTRQISNFSESFPDASVTEPFSSTGSIDNETTSTVDSSSSSVPVKENEELNMCMDSVDTEGLACNQINPVTVENQFNCEDDFLINEPFIWGDEWSALSHESNEIPRFQEKKDQVSSLQPNDSMSGYREDDDLFRELQSTMVDSCTNTSPIHQLWNMQLQNDDDCIDFWLNMLGQVGPLPSLYQHLTSQA